MDIEIIKNTLSEDTFAYVGRASEEENLEEFKYQLKTYIESIKQILEADFDKLSDQQLYEMLTKVYSISLDEDDYLSMLSKYNNKEYNYIYKIPTTMIFVGKASEGHGRSFDCWVQDYQIYYLVVASEEFDFDYNKIYSIAEINELVSNKTIMLLKEDSEAIDDYVEFAMEGYQSLETLDINITGYSDNISKFINDNYSLFGDLLRKKFPREKVLDDMKGLIEELDDEINDVFFSSNNPSDYLYFETSKKCKEWYELSSEKEEYQNIKKRLK